MTEQQMGKDMKYDKSYNHQKMQRFVKRASLTDLDRFKVMVARKNKSYALIHAGGKQPKAAAPKKGKK